MIQVQFKKLTPTAIIPEYKSAEAAGMDLFSDESCIINPISSNMFSMAITIQRQLIKTGIAIELPIGYEAQIRPRSGLALKHGITVLNSPGTIDSDYRDGIGVILINLGEQSFKINKGDRIAQLIIAPVVRAQMIEVKELSQSERGLNGFGSSGIR
jgi:dUTP pyrophosphatase